MQILQIANSDNVNESGAVRSMVRLHLALQSESVRSRILCGSRTTTSPDVQRIKEIPPRTIQLISSALNRAAIEMGLRNLGPINSFFLHRSPFFQEADVLHIHSIHNSTFSYASLPSLTKEKPTIFTLHDMWPATGHCAFSHDCDRWRTGCGKCPYPDEFPPIKRDSTRIEWHLKRRAFERSNLTFVAPSRWVASVIESSVANGKPVHHIPYGIDTSLYRPHDQDRCRRELGVPLEKRVIMAGAINVSSFRKGGDLLIAALDALPRTLKNETVLLLMGNQGSNLRRSAGLDVVDLGYVTDEAHKAKAFSAADVFVFPTRADNLPLTLQESMACGTPMVSFDVGGVPDLVRDGTTGFLASHGNTKEFADAIVRLLEDQPLRETMRANCRRVATTEYAMDIALRRHLALYRQVTAAT